MDSLITLSANNKIALNQLIDAKLKQGYLLKGGMQEGEGSTLTQTMVLPNNIDAELTIHGAIKLVIVLCMMTVIFYFTL